MDFNHLSDELLLHVFVYLDQCNLLRIARVCRRWMRICYDAQFWMHIDFFATFPHCDINLALQHLATRLDAARVRSLDLTRCSVSLHGVDVIMQRFCNIDELSLSWCKNRLADERQGVVWTVQYLTTLVLAGCTYLRDEDAVVIATCCRQLRHLDLSYCDQKLTDGGVIYFAENCHHLEYLSLNSCTRLTGSGVSAFGASCSKLQYFNVNSIERLTDQSLVEVVSQNPNLESLHLDFTEHVSDVSIVAIANSCNKMKDLHLFLCFDISDAGLEALAHGCRDLQYIGLFGSDGVTDSGVQSIANGCRHLDHLEISANRSISDDALICVSQCLPHVKHLRFRQCNKITHRGVLKILEHCTKLLTLLLQECPSIGKGMNPRVDYDIFNTDNYKKLPSSLAMLDLSICQSLSDRCLWLISRLCPSLQELDVSICGLLTDSAVLGISQHCCELVSLKLHWCVLLTDESLDHVARCSKLRRLTVGCCDEITDAAVDRLRRRLSACTISGMRRSNSDRP
ncbi:F-box/LRR-repeat protein 2-like [Corticium candelabrum]|uniref:F-box/LRR-repeat protein 2-like n=1 Tax=Corticium candelabrum TaxID=121492 RepID=UPI002E34702A|nr:F-box/LRR-repeat protein 2-like [Corticium candelabrum]